MLDLRARAEPHLGGPITPEEFEQAEPYARHKLALINSREGTEHGDDYLAILIAETVKANRFSAFTIALCSLLTEDDEEPTGRENGTKKEPHSKARPLTLLPILPRP